jgi:hypothetical protein
MQKLINVIALLSGLTCASLVGGGVYVYMQKDALLESAKEAATAAAMEAVTGALPGMVGGMMPEMPSMTGGATPSVGDAPTVPSVTGGALPF